MLELGQICENYCTDFYCYFLLNGNRLVCSYDAINDLPDTFDENISLSFDVNPTMSISYDNNTRGFTLSVYGPFGGIYYECATNLTIDECRNLLSFFKNLTNTYKL